jgi:hypothetical protein
MKPKKLTYNGSSKVIQYIVTCVNWLLDNGGGSVSSLSDVELTNLSDGQILQYNSTSEKWENTDNQGSLPFEIVIDENDNGINIVYDDGGE